MKRSGFTLAEVLIALGIIGVISALTMPTFTAKTQTAKVGPQLAKAVANFEQAAKMVLADNEADMLTEVMVCPPNGSSFSYTCDESAKVRMGASSGAFWNGMSTHLVGYGTGVFHTDDGAKYYFTNILANPSNPEEASARTAFVFYNPAEDNNDGTTISHSFPLNKPGTDGENLLAIDINGNKLPNKAGQDIFYFMARQSGRLIPRGYNGWETTCPINKKVTDLKAKTKSFNHVINENMNENNIQNMKDKVFLI